ncbi:hypothetical protein N7478_010238 [Penicillium angulare]|uniref:uncharacterized protein n=1 Tax=Penicillium angulare TaxID=116970 RepID=UPI002541161B|nr:uncharacterized protein N7478_010238 [Penicillium angulare]KAJ5267430.1 hypothetical protein N7478_010238 [Penicillium angulare]
MDTLVTSLPPDVGAILMRNIAVIEIVSMFSIGAYNSLETVVLIFDAFKHYRGLYFWSMQVAAWGILVHAIPAMARFMSQSSNLAVSIPFMIGWYAMVTGQAIMLYSRLRIVVRDATLLRWVLWMIIITACAFHIPMTVLFFGVNSGDARFVRPAMIYDRIQVTGFCIQDLIICGLYMREAMRSLKLITQMRGPDGRKVMIHLIWVNVLVVVMNILLLITEYKVHYIQVSFKTVVYSIKLKLEFSVLNRLCTLVQSSPCICQQSHTQQGPPDNANSQNAKIESSNDRSDMKERSELNQVRSPQDLPPSHASGLGSTPPKRPDNHIRLREDFSSASTFFDTNIPGSATGSAEGLCRVESEASDGGPKLDV